MTTKIIRNKLSIDCISEQDILGHFLSTWTEDRTCLIIMPDGLRDYAHVVNSILGEGQNDLWCKGCLQAKRATATPDFILHDLVRDSALLTVHCKSVNHARTFYNLLMDGRRKVGDVRHGDIALFEIWSNGEKVLPKT